MNDVDRAALKAIAAEFDRAAAKYPPLYHQQLSVIYFDSDGTPFQPLNEKHWANFVKANSPAPNGLWQEWHGPYQGRNHSWLGRFHGDPQGLEIFMELGLSLMLVLRKALPDNIMEFADFDERGFPPVEGFTTLLDLMHQVAFEWPLPLLRSSGGVWGWGTFRSYCRFPASKSLEYPEMVEASKRKMQEPEREVEAKAIIKKALSWQGPLLGDASYPLYPAFDLLDVNLFVATKAFIDLLLNPSESFFISGDFNDMPFGKESSSESSEEDRTPEWKQADFAFSFDAADLMWRVRFKYDAGILHTTFPPSKGFDYIGYMMGHPNESISCSTLEASTRRESHSTGNTISNYERKLAGGVLGRRGIPLADNEELEDIHEKFTELNEGIKDARAADDTERETKLLQEKAKLRRCVRPILNRRGRSRTFGTDTDNQAAAKRVRSAINDATEHIFRKAPKSSSKDGLLKFYEHLTTTLAVDGTYCRYVLKDPPPWVF